MVDRPARTGRRTFRGISSLGIVLVALAIAVLVQATAIGAVIDRLLDPVRFELLDHPASGRVAIVEMDAASTAVIERWPWPRDNYARVIDNLRRAGAASVVFDVDLGAAGTAAGDREMAAALARSDGLVALPTFSQVAGSGDHRVLDAMPLPLFRPHVALASVSIAPDEDGLVRHMPLGTMTYGIPHPTLSALIAHRSGSADQVFPIDFSIDPETVPRLSFVAVRDGRFDRAMVRGKDVLIGATAIEMGDRYAVPRWRNLFGVVIQALAAETLLRGLPHEIDGAAAIALALALAIPVVATRRSWTTALAFAGGLAGLSTVLLLSQRHGVYVPAAGGLALLVAALGGQAVRTVVARFHRQRLVDEESGLPNRRALLSASPASGRGRPLLAITVTNYDKVAAVTGDGGGAQLMARLSDRIGALYPGDAVYRIGDASLALWIDEHDPVGIIRQLRTTLLAPVEVAGRKLDASVSFGMSVDERDSETALQGALLAAEQAAHAGLPWKLASDDLSEVAKDVSLLGELDEALIGGDVMVHYQPKLSLATGRISGGEALVRWRRPDGSYVPPAMFIPIAEAANRIAPLTVFVLATVLADLERWLGEGEKLVVAVNISATLLGDEEFDDEVDRLLACHAVPPSALIFEVTESASFENADLALRSLERFSARGIAISMDDYGTGQSSLSYLQRLPLSEIKIDRGFVVNATRNPRDAMMVRSTIELAHELGLKVVAEGVEDQECLALLTRFGCDTVQGYHVAKPQAPDDFRRVVSATQRPDGPTVDRPEWALPDHRVSERRVGV